MDELRLNYQSVRSEKARISVRISPTVLILLSISMVALLASGFGMILIGSPIGWALIGFSVIPAMITEWHKGELHHMAVSSTINSIDDVLSVEVLGRLPKKPSPLDIANVVSLVPGGQFFAARFGISAIFMQQLSSNNKDDTQAVWQEALALRQQTKSKNVSAAVLTVALIKCAPNYQSLISHLQLDIDDLIYGIDWYNYLRGLIDIHRLPRRTGGLARDWSFGWTPLLNRFGQNISQQINLYGDSLHQTAAHDDAINQLIDIFSSDGRQNAILVGPEGVGKTKIVQALAMKLMDGLADVPSKLRFRQVFVLDASALIASASGRGEIEKLVPRILAEAYKAKNIIICLDNAQLFFEEAIGSVDITNILLPIIEAGNLRMILTMDEQPYLKISKRDPRLVNSINRISVEPATERETFAVMEDRSITIEFQYHVTFMYQALSEAYRLSERYIHDLSMPGKAVSLMESSVHYNENGLVTAKSVQMAIEKTLGIKVGVASDDQDREKLLNLEDLIHKQMINQKRAVKVVSDALRRSRSGVRNQNRPIGTFLFLGPTGVGKTELSKALADVYFGGEGSMIRLDMNEYTNSEDAERLIADGSDNPNSLTALVMKRPFSVILLDEIEKAHPNVLSMLLQMLDEGILRDIKNREVSFRDAIIIATSNAGADRIREYIERGYDVEQFESKFVDELINSKQFKSEFLNRFDEIVTFRPLNKDELLQVVDLMLAGVNKTLALQKVTVKVADDAKEYLVEAGYDPRLGARPMRRVIQRTVENTVAKKMLEGKVEAGSTIEITYDQVKEILDSQLSAKNLLGK